MTVITHWPTCENGLVLHFIIVNALHTKSDMQPKIVHFFYRPLTVKWRL